MPQSRKTQGKRPIISEIKFQISRTKRSLMYLLPEIRPRREQDTKFSNPEPEVQGEGNKTHGNSPTLKESTRVRETFVQHEPSGMAHSDYFNDFNHLLKELGVAA